MNIQHGVSLSNYSTMRLGGPASHLTTVTTKDELAEAVSWASNQALPIIMIGGGSNIIWRDEGFAGLVIVNKITGYTINSIDQSTAEVTIGAGESWDEVVARSVADGYSGIEALSLIPGSAGATPVQNVGAYGQEISQTLIQLEAYDLEAHDYVTVPASACDFGYRTSRFKTKDRGRFFITSITLRLSKTAPQPPFYPALQKYLDETGAESPSVATIREAVIAIRSSKLPNPALVANNGSFFANPVISQQQLEVIQSASEQPVPHWPTNEGLVKVAAAWLVENAGFKDYHDADTGMATWHNQSLVLVNEGAESTVQLIAFREMITTAVKQKFGVTLEQEPELLP